MIKVMQNKIDSIGEKAVSGGKITREEALFILMIRDEYLLHLLSWTDKIRQTSNSNSIDLCSVINARSGGCTEDCSFCSQSVHFSTGIGTYPLMPIEKIIEGAWMAKSCGATKFCLSTSGTGIKTRKELDKLCTSVERIRKEVGIGVCATLGALTEDDMVALKAAGLSRFHHNLETAEAYFHNICTTHTYQNRIDEVRVAKKVGLSTCSGGIFGIGESLEHRVDFAFEIMALDVDSVPVNFLMPVKGTPLAGISPISPLDSLKIIALLRFLMPDKEVRVCGGRTTALHELHPLIFAAGANGMMIGNYLTRTGREPDKDLQMLKDLGLQNVSI